MAVKRFQILIATVGLLLVGCMSSPTKFNSPPAITSLNADPTSIKVGEVSVLTANAYDPEGKNLTYSWSTVLGSIWGSGSQVNYIVTCGCAIETANQIILKVKDSQGAETQKTMRVMIFP